MKILAVDYGDSRTGLAACDRTEFLASPLGIIQEKSMAKVVEKIVYATREYDIGMVIIGLASLIIGETFLPKGKMWMKAFGAVLGSIVYRFIIAIALRLDLPSECLKLISATIVALAIGLPAIKAAARPATSKGGK